MLALGHTLDHRYEILSELGRGGMGCVYRVRHTQLGQTYALKLLLSADPHAEAQFRQEARILAGLAHPGLPRVIDSFSTKGQHCLVMEHVDGDDLQVRLDARGRPFEEAEVRPWLAQLLAALAYLHAQQVVHRDIKPGNLKVTPEGRLVLVDFGIAKAPEGGPGRTGFHAKGAYTPYLAAPEQVGGQPTDARTDLYAVGSTFTYLLSGHLPPDPRALGGTLAPVLARAMAPDPAGRWPDAMQMARACGPAIATPAGAPPVRRDIRRP